MRIVLHVQKATFCAKRMGGWGGVILYNVVGARVIPYKCVVLQTNYCIRCVLAKLTCIPT